MDYLVVIYSCQANKTKSTFLYNLIQSRLPCKVYILMGVPTLNTDFQIVDKYLLIKCNDFYENLCEKTIVLMKTILQLFPNVKGLFKCDDDVLLNINHFQHFLNCVSTHPIDYAGKLINCENSLSTHHYHKCSNSSYNTYKQVYGCTYAAGPLYYVNFKSIQLLSTTNYNKYFFEDNMVGHVLNRLTKYNYISYYDTINYNVYTIQNDNHTPFLFIKLHGRLGNQLFMASAAYELSKKHNMILILIINNENMDILPIFDNFHYMYINDVNVDVINYKENECFSYDPIIITQRRNYMLDGYFQNKKYIFNFDASIFCMNSCSNLLLKYPLLSTSYFIHIRRGDYVNNSLYAFDQDIYYKKAIDYILTRDSNSHFFVTSDDISYINTYNVLQNINKTVIDTTTLETFYIMSMCKKGGICANSTYSGWASKLNTNHDKIVIVPKQWINVNYNYEIPFDYTISL